MGKRTIPQTAKDLIAAKKLIEDPENWIRGALRNECGQQCAMGALYSALGSEDFLTCGRSDDAYLALSRSSLELFKTRDPAQANDELGHTAVMEMFSHAIQSEIEKANS